MLAELLDEAFAVLRDESPVHARALREKLVDRVIVFTVDGERMVSGGAGLVPATFGDAARGPDLQVDTDSATVLALLDDRITLLDAVRAGSLRARGPRAAIAAAEEAMRVFIHGLVRCPSAPRLLVRFRRIVARREVNHA